MGGSKVLQREFFARDAVEVARACIGTCIVAESDSESCVLVGRIVEAEAYRGPEDRAAHSFGNRRTPRTEVMFGPPGHAYIFQIYGQHFHLNAVTGIEGSPQAVLIRAVEPLSGQPVMARRRSMAADRVELTNGPGKLCQAFGIDKRWYGWDLTCGRNLYFTEGRPAARVLAASRVGVEYAAEWATRAWRFFDADSRYVSKARGASLASEATVRIGR